MLCAASFTALFDILYDSLVGGLGTLHVSGISI